MVRSLVSRFSIGLVTVPLVIILAVVVTQLWGPVFGMWGWMEFSAILLVLTVMLFALAEEFFRTPNVYGRTHHLYDLRDVPRQQQLQSASAMMLWQALPPTIAAIVLFVMIRVG